MLLEYEKQIFADLLDSDGLLIMARGLGVYRIVGTFMKPFCHPASLVLVINASSHEEEYLIERLRNDGVEQLPHVIGTEVTRDERVGVYLKGGVVFVSSRMLVMDLLTEKVPAHLITGILVYNAHRVKEAGLEAFIMRLYRGKNTQGFIKAFSDNPLTFTDGYCQIEKVMKNLYLRKLFLYPRFQVSVKDSLERSEPEVIEIGVPSSTAMRACQMALLELINLCIKEVKMCNPMLDLEGISYDSLISTAFDAVVRIQLDPIWHQLTNKTKQLVSDLKVLRELIRSLTHFDCVTFYSMVRSIKASEKQFKDNTGWLHTDSADKLYMFAKQRLYGTVEQQAKSTSKELEEKALLVEKNPKWAALSEVMEEITATEEALTTGDLAPPPSRVLIAVDSPQTCSQLKDFLVQGAEVVMRRLLAKFEQPVSKDEADSSVKKSEKEAAKETVQPSKAKKQKMSTDDKQVTLTQLARGETTAPPEPASMAEQVAADNGIETIERGADVKTKLPSNCTTALVALRTNGDPNCLIRTLDALQPKYVIMFDLDIPYIRQLEVYKACRPGVQFRVYIMMFSGSSEEQRYLTAIRKEKLAFEELIRQKAAMVIPENREGRLAGDQGDTPANQTVSSRKGGIQQADNSPNKVIVDMREFRSDLPFLVHRLGIGLEPVTLEVGDYILTEDICVERKSVSDLIGSLNNGRLYSQCTSMNRYYNRPVLLIEFDPTRPFTLQKNFNLQQEISINDIQSRLALLTLHFSNLRLLWCQSSHGTADLFRDLKRGSTQPDVDKAMTVTSDDSKADAKYNLAARDVLMKLPSVSTKNVNVLADKVCNLKQLASLTAKDLGVVLANKMAAESIVTFLNTEFSPEEKDSGKVEQTSVKRPARKGARR